MLVGFWDARADKTGTGNARRNYIEQPSCCPGKPMMAWGSHQVVNLSIEKRDPMRTRAEHAHLGEITTAILASKDFAKAA